MHPFQQLRPLGSISESHLQNVSWDLFARTPLPGEIQIMSVSALALNFLQPKAAAQVAQIALAAADAVMTIYDEATHWQVDKADRSPLTQADLQSNAIILKALGAMEPNIPILSEESPWQGGAAATFWAVDPLDGTKEFLARNGEFTINIALVIDGVARLGIICAPAHKTVWAGIVHPSQSPWAARIEVAQLTTSAIDLDSWSTLPTAQELRNDDHASGPRVLRSRSHGHSEPLPSWLLGVMRSATIAEVGSALKFCLIAQGQADLYARWGPTAIWDTAAGQAILTASGGAVIDAETFVPLTYADPRVVLNPNFIAHVPTRLGIANWMDR